MRAMEAMTAGQRALTRNILRNKLPWISLKGLGVLLAGKEGLEIFMTRSGDYYITLKYRTEFANRHNAGPFVSIHCNSNPRAEAHGREIFVYSAKASNKEAEVAAVRENANQDFLNFTLSDLRHSKYNVLSQTLAEKIEERMQQGFGHRDRRIQKAPFYVLARVDMPSILIETAFISNHDEEQKLKDSQWKERMAQAIADGILDYKEKVEKSLENQQELGAEAIPGRKRRGEHT